MGGSATQSIPSYEGLRVSREEYLDLRDDGFLYDMIDGVLHMSPSAFFEHNSVILHLSMAIGQYLRAHPIALAAPETDVFLPDGGDVLRPDISIVFRERESLIRGHIHGAPDIVVEVLSDTTRRRDLGVKADRYLKTGVREYWILDPDEKSMAIRENVGQAEWAVREGDGIESRLLPGLVLRRDLLFP